MSLNFSIANVVYVKNLSADATESDVRQKFEDCDEILGISFKNFPGKNQKYCQIEFKSSEGITKASRLNGEPLLNVPMTVTVIEPVLHNHNVTQIKSGNEQDHGNTDKNKSGNISETLSNVSNALNVQSNQNVRPTTLTAEENQKGVSVAQNNANTKNSRLDEFSRIVYIENIPENFNASHIDVLFRDVGRVANRKIHFHEKKKAFAAFVEFETEEEAKNALNLNGLRVGGNEILIKDAFSLMNGNDLSKNNLPFFSSKNENILNYKPTVSEKVEKVLALKEKLTAKLCAMYKPNLLLMNNLIAPTNSSLLASINAADPNQNTNTALMNASALVNAIVKAKEEREKEKKLILPGDRDTSVSKGIENGSREKKGEQDKTKDKIKDKSNKRKHSRDGHYDSESDSSNCDLSNTDKKYKKRKHKENKRKVEKRSTRNVSKRKKSRRYSPNYSDYSSRSSNSDSRSTSSTNSSNTSGSHNSSVIRSNSSDFDNDKRGRSGRRSRRSSKDRYVRERKRRKKRNEHKRSRSYSDSNYSSSGYGTSSDGGSSNVSRRSERGGSKSIESKSDTPWWVRESRKMEIRQRMKEKRLRGGGGRDYKRSDFWGRSKYRRR